MTISTWPSTSSARPCAANTASSTVGGSRRTRRRPSLVSHTSLISHLPVLAVSWLRSLLRPSVSRPRLDSGYDYRCLPHCSKYIVQCTHGKIKGIIPVRQVRKMLQRGKRSVHSLNRAAFRHFGHSNHRMRQDVRGSMISVTNAMGLGQRLHCSGGILLAGASSSTMLKKFSPGFCPGVGVTLNQCARLVKIDHPNSGAVRSFAFRFCP